MNSSDVIALAALIVALVALINTISQVLQQYFATADGYRRCSSSVMGNWARFTKRKFKWRELRFETIFATPVIFLEVAYDLRRAQSQGIGSTIILDGSEGMSEWPGLQRSDRFDHKQRWSHERPIPLEKQPVTRRRTFRTPPIGSIKQFLRRNTPLVPLETPLEKFLALDQDPYDNSPENEPVSWIPLMYCLQQYSESLVNCGLSVFQDLGAGSLCRGRILTPAIRISKKSWDFMPPEISKPLALSNIQDVVTMAQYLGCRWTNFKPEEGMLRAESDGIMITSADVRSLGTVISFTKTDRRVEDRRELHGVVFSPFEGAAKLGFGIIYSDLLGGEFYRIYSLEDCQDTINHLTNSMKDLTKLPKPILQNVITDILGILTPVYRPRSTAITYVVKPSEFVSDNNVSTRGPVEVLLSDTVVSCRGAMDSFLSELGGVLRCHDLDPLSGSQDTWKRRAHLESISQVAQLFVRSKKWRRDFGRPIIAYQKYRDEGVIALLEALHQAWDDATSFLSSRRVACRAILRVHFLVMLECWEQILDIQRQSPLRYPENAAAAQRRLMKLYFDKCRRRCMEEVPRMTREDAATVEEVWITTMFRGICWHAIHNFDERVIAVPSRCFDGLQVIFRSAVTPRGDIHVKGASPDPAMPFLSSSDAVSTIDYCMPASEETQSERSQDTYDASCHIWNS